MDYAQLFKLLYSGEWERPLLAQAGDAERGDMVLVAEALSRGNSKTEGFKSRVVPVPEAAVPFFSSETAATRAKAQMDGSRASTPRSATVWPWSPREGIGIKSRRKHYSSTVLARKRFDRAADRMFFRHCGGASRSLRAATTVFDAKRAFLAELMAAAEAELEAALPAVPCPAMLRPRAEARARRACGKLRATAVCRELFVEERSDVAA